MRREKRSATPATASPRWTGFKVGRMLLAALLQGGVAWCAAQGIAATPSGRPAAEGHPSQGRPAVAARPLASPLSGYFEENIGQSDPQVRFFARGEGFTLFVTERELVVSSIADNEEGTSPGSAPWPLEQRRIQANAGPEPNAAPAEIIRLRWVGASRSARVIGEGTPVAHASYFLGNDPARWRAGAPLYRSVRLAGAYAGIELLLRASRSGATIEVDVAPGADPDAVKLAVEGSQKVELSPGGELVAQGLRGTLRMSTPFAHQEELGQKVPVEARFSLGPTGIASLAVARRDATNRLAITPSLEYSTCIPHGAYAQVTGLALDGNGGVYLAGESFQDAFPGDTPVQRPFAGNLDLFVAKIDSGGALEWVSFVGGSQNELNEPSGQPIALDTGGTIYLVGDTESTDFPVTPDAPQSSLRGASDGIVVRLDPSGTILMFGTYIGGAQAEWGISIALASSGDAYLAGSSTSPDLPIAGAGRSYFGNGDAFVARLGAGNLGLTYLTYLGGSDRDWPLSIAVDHAGAVFIAGFTSSGDFPLQDPLDPTHTVASAPVGCEFERDAFLAKLAPDGSTLAFSTYLGGGDYDVAYDVAVDPNGDVCVVGATMSSDFPTANALQATLRGCGDFFVTKVRGDGSQFVYSTYLGGNMGCMGGPAVTCSNQAEWPLGVATDAEGRCYVAGRGGEDFPLANPIQAVPGGGVDATVTVLSPTGSELQFSTFLGGQFDDQASDIAVDPTGTMFIAGSTWSPDFPVTTGPPGGCAAAHSGTFVAKLSPIFPLAIDAAASPTSGPWPLPVHLFANASGGAPPYAYDWSLGDGHHTHDADPVITYYGAGTYHVTLSVTDSDGAVATGSLDITALPTCQLGCSAEAPDRVLLGSPASFAAHTETTECTGPLSLLWDLGDSSPPSSEASLTHTYAAGGTYTWHMTATSDGKTCEVSRTITVDDISCSGPYDLFIPAAAHTPGVNGTAWQTDLDLLYLGLLEAHVDLALLKANQANLTPQIASVIVPSGRALRLTDVLGTLLPASNAALGVRFCGGRPLVNARFYTTTCNNGGTCGMYIPGVGADRAVTPSRHGVFHHLSYSPDPLTGFRVNIGFVSAVGFAVQVVVRLYGDDGSLLGILTRTLQPYEHLQLTRVHALAGTPAVASGWATVEVTTPGGEVHSYAMSIDNRSGDAIYMPPDLIPE